MFFIRFGNLCGKVKAKFIEVYSNTSPLIQTKWLIQVLDPAINQIPYSRITHLILYITIIRLI